MEGSERPADKIVVKSITLRTKIEVRCEINKESAADEAEKRRLEKEQLNRFSILILRGSA